MMAMAMMPPITPPAMAPALGPSLPPPLLLPLSAPSAGASSFSQIALGHLSHPGMVNEQEYPSSHWGHSSEEVSSHLTQSPERALRAVGG